MRRIGISVLIVSVISAIMVLTACGSSSTITVYPEKKSDAYTVTDGDTTTCSQDMATVDLNIGKTVNYVNPISAAETEDGVVVDFDRGNRNSIFRAGIVNGQIPFTIPKRSTVDTQVYHLTLLEIDFGEIKSVTLCAAE